LQKNVFRKYLKPHKITTYAIRNTNWKTTTKYSAFSSAMTK